MARPHDFAPASRPARAPLGAFAKRGPDTTSAAPPAASVAQASVPASERRQAI